MITCALFVRGAAARPPRSCTARNMCLQSRPARMAVSFFLFSLIRSARCFSRICCVFQSLAHHPVPTACPFSFSPTTHPCHLQHHYCHVVTRTCCGPICLCMRETRLLELDGVGCCLEQVGNYAPPGRACVCRIKRPISAGACSVGECGATQRLRRTPNGSTSVV